jgi:hypothetical protein
MAEESTNRAAETVDFDAAGPVEPDPAAGIGMPARGTTRRPQGASIIRDAANRSIDMLFEHLQECAKSRPNGTLSFAEIRDEVANFKSYPSAKVNAFYRETWNECLQAFQSTQWAEDNTQAFERLILSNFSHLLPPVGDPPIRGKNLSRRIIDPFINVLRQLLGPDQFDQYQAAADRMVSRLQSEHGASFNWDMVTREPTAQTVVNDVLVHISQHFMKMGKRRRWMIDMMASGMPPAETREEQEWQFGDREFHMLVDALYFGIRGALDSETDRQLMVRRYDEKNVARLYTMLQLLDRDYMEVMRREGQQ